MHGDLRSFWARPISLWRCSLLMLISISYTLFVSCFGTLTYKCRSSCSEIVCVCDYSFSKAFSLVIFIRNIFMKLRSDGTGAPCSQPTILITFRHNFHQEYLYILTDVSYVLATFTSNHWDGLKYIFTNVLWKPVWVLQGQIGVFLNPNDVFCHMRSLKNFSTKNEDFFLLLHFHFLVKFH